VLLPHALCYCCTSPFVFPFSDIHLPKCHLQPGRVIPSRVTRHDFPLVGWRGLGCGECGVCSDRAHNSVYGEQFCSNTSCLFRKYKWRPVLNEARAILRPILRTWKWQYITMPYRNPLNTAMRRTRRGISCSLNRMGILKVCHPRCVVIKHIVESRAVNKHNRYWVWYYKCIEEYIIIELLWNVISISYIIIVWGMLLQAF
jgi:hypothetical protein